MSREIKFRAWDTDLCRYYYLGKGDFHIGGHGANTFTNEWLKDLLDGGFVQSGGFHKPKILEQWTGLHDVNGREVFEGDVVHGIQIAEEDHRRLSWPGEVVFKNGCYALSTGWEYRILGMYKYIEVIGNIHTDMELLKEQK